MSTDVEPLRFRDTERCQLRADIGLYCRVGGSKLTSWARTRETSAGNSWRGGEKRKRRRGKLVQSQPREKTEAPPGNPQQQRPLPLSPATTSERSV